jgi:opacity protein-like surface antigen
MRPFVGGGVAFIQLDVLQTESGMLGPGAPFSTVIVDADDSGVGLWINGGLLYRVGNHFNLGLDVRYSDADADLSVPQVGSDLGLDSGGIHYGVALGYHW